MRYVIKIAIFLYTFSLAAAVICFGQTDEAESFTICTFYPAPTGVYSTLRLKPSDNAPGGPALQPGTLYYSNTTNMLRYYNKTRVWVNLTGGGGGTYWEYDGATKVLRNTNAGKVIIDGTPGYGGTYGRLLQIYGTPRIQGKNGNSTLYLSRPSASADYSHNLIFHTNDTANRSWDLGMSKDSSWPYSRFVLGHIDPADGNTPIYQVTILENGSVGLRSDQDEPFWGAKAKLHIVNNDYGTESDPHWSEVMNGNGKVGWEMSSASDNATLGPVINWYRAKGTLAARTAVGDEAKLAGLATEGYSGGGSMEQVGAIVIDGANTFNATSNPAHLHFYGSNTTADGDWVERICVMDSGEIDFNFNTWYDNYKLHVCVDFPDCDVWGGITSDHTDKWWWSSASDGRFKKNISGIEDALEKVLRAKGIRYDSITEKSSSAKKGRHFGFIGQDLEKVMPELVDADSQGYRSVSYDLMAPVLVEAIKDQQKQIESLRQEVEALKARKKQGSI